MGKPLVIVESPAKAKTISRFLGEGFDVRASVGHVRDLPQSAADIPEALKKQKWARLGVDVENEFRPLYIVTRPDVIRDLKKAAKEAPEIYLATDEDREGESIAWHLLEELKPKAPVKRMVFHEITANAIKDALDATRAVDKSLVDAQETRRILDRLYGYEVSPVLWRMIGSGLSAGRVQSVAVRLIVARERERMAFHSAAYWDLEATCATEPSFTARLTALNGARVATGKDFDDQGRVKNSAVRVLGEADARGLAQRLAGRKLSVVSLEHKPYNSSPKPPFITSTLQQEGGRKLRMSAQQVMRVAQGLYERGYITYMRTDSTTLSGTAISAARAQVRQLFGEEYLSPAPRQYARKVKNAQEAHEAIRPAGETFRTPDSLSGELRSDELRLYELIWKRTLASQMKDAQMQSVQVKLGVETPAGEKAEFSASGRTIVFAGFMRAYVEGADDPEAELENREERLPALKERDTVPVSALEPKGHETQPPARFTEASLVKRLEELGIGRPSTYASIMETIQAKYVWKKAGALIPNWVAFAVVNLLEKHFHTLVEYDFTAKLEDDLDEIAEGKQQRVPWLNAFYNGKAPGLKRLVSDHLGQINAAEINSILLGTGTDGQQVVVKPGRYGPYVKRGEETASVPEDIPPDELTLARAEELLAAPKGDTPIGFDPTSGQPIYAKPGRFGPYVQLGTPDSLAGEKPKTASLFKSMSLETLTVADALQLLSLPRTIGSDPADGVEVTAHNGRFGPYVQKGEERRNLPDGDEAKLLTIGLEEALALLRAPRVFRGRGRGAAAPKPPLASFGNDPVSGKPIVAKDGRFGIYLTDGATNVSLRKGEALEDVTPDRAAELLAIKREQIASGQVKGPRRKAARTGKPAARSRKKTPVG
jgi:DNA topoisomerase-1